MTKIVVIVVNNSTIYRIFRFCFYVREFRKKIKRRDHLNANRELIIIIFIQELLIRLIH
jgi:hypothetical protein